MTDLTNTKWVLNKVLNSQVNMNKSVTFETNGTKMGLFGYTYVSTEQQKGGLLYYITYGGQSTKIVYSAQNGWTDDLYRTIKITGGNSVTDQSFINWLKANAKQLEIIPIMTNLSGSGQDEFVENWAQMAQTALYEQGISNKFLQSNQAQYILAKAVTDLIEDGNFSNTTLSLIATLRCNHPHSEDETE